jgi:hypothetical protein
VLSGGQKLGRLATVTPIGQPHAGPVIVGFDADSNTLPTIEAGAG